MRKKGIHRTCLETTGHWSNKIGHVSALGVFFGKKKAPGDPRCFLYELAAVNVNLFVHELFDAEAAKFTTKAAALDAAKGQVRSV